jgi:alpha-galactosidase/6-phospho-beta-glucosidase family protein
MATAVRIGVIGAGSAVFSLGLVKDIILTPGLAGSQIVFMDINPERLAAVTRLAGRYADEIDADLRFEQTADREPATFQTGDRSMLLYNALMSPQTRSYEQDVAVLNDLLALAGHEALAAHYAGPRVEEASGPSPALLAGAEARGTVMAD